MRALAAIQRDFLDALVDDRPARDAGMEIYRRTAAASWHGALVAAYPVVLRLVGRAFFREATSHYAARVPSASGDLNEFGAGFATFLARYPHANTLEYLGDVGRLEWALHESGRAAEAAALDYAALARAAAADPGAIRFRVHPAVRLLESQHPILALWEANQEGRDGTPAQPLGACRVLVRRVGGEAWPVALDQGEWIFLGALSAGATLDHACASLGDAAAELIGPLLARLARDGVLCDFEAPVRA